MDAVIKGDVRLVRIGALTNVQDKTIIQEATAPLDGDHDGSTIIGHYVTIGHKCVLRACTIENKVIVGMGSVIEEGAYIESNSIIGAGSVVAAGTRVPAFELWMGRPAKFVRSLTEDEIHSITISAVNYRNLGAPAPRLVSRLGRLADGALAARRAAGHRIGALEWPAVDPDYGFEKPDI
jgi:carbonic anhydrase/acetyltransferase-like protein (isoleucine patch superfamily)